MAGACGAVSSGMMSGRSAPPGTQVVHQVSFRCGSLEDVIAFHYALTEAGVDFDHEISHGNAIGIGMADFTTKRLVQSIDAAATSMNALTALSINSFKIPMAFENDREAISRILETVPLVNGRAHHVVRIQDTLNLEKVEVSERDARYEEGGHHRREELRALGHCIATWASKPPPSARMRLIESASSRDCRSVRKLRCSSTCVSAVSTCSRLPMPAL